MNTTQPAMHWQISVPIFKNSVILKQLGIVIGIPFGILIAVLFFTGKQSVYSYYAIGLICALLFLTWVFMMLFYGGKYDAEFVLDESGVLCRTQQKQQKKNRIVNGLAVVLGLLSGKPGVAGAGMLAQSRQEVFLKWNQIRKISYQPRSNTILLRGGWTESIGIFCTQENYPMVEQLVRSKTQGQSTP